MPVNKNILITGIHGFVGSNLVKVLGDEYTLYGLDIVSPQKEGVRQTFNWDETGQIPSVDAIIHLAGKAHDVEGASDVKSYFEVNTGLTKQIFDYFLQSDARKFVFFSSVKAVADTVPGEVLDEEAEPDPKTPYGQSKLEAERYIQSQNIPDDKKVFILRPCMIHGPGNKGNLNLLYSVVSKGIPWPLGAFENQRSFLSIDNLIFVIQEILKGNTKPGVYQVCDDEPLSTNDLVHVISEVKGKKSRILNIPRPIIQGIAKLGNVLPLPINEERLKKLTENYVASNKKLTAALGKSLPVSAKDGLRKTIASFQ